MQTNKLAWAATKINDPETTKYGCNHGLYHDYHHEHGGKNNAQFMIVSIINPRVQLRARDTVTCPRSGAH